MHRDNRCLYMVYVCFMSVVVTVGVCGNVCCVAAIVKDSVFLLHWSVVVCLCVMDVVFSNCIVMRGAVDPCVWEV